MPYEFTSIYFDEPIREGRAIDVFAPAKTARDTAIYFIHGGGWRGGSRHGFHDIMRAFNAEGFLCASTDYRLSGVNIFDQIEDVRRGYEILLGRLNRSQEVFVIGSSARAHLAAMLVVKGQRRIAGAALQSTPVRFEPWKDIFPGIWASMQDIVGVPWEKRPSLYRRVSPIHHVLKRTPPMFFLEAENEHMFPLAHTIEFVRRMKALGRRARCKVYANAEHGFFYDVTRRQQKEAFADILSFIKSCES